MRKSIVMLAPILLAACGAAGEDAGPAPADVDAAEAATQEALPEGFTLPPGTQVASTTEVSTEAGEGQVFLLDSTSAPEALEAHFRSEAEAAGFAMSDLTKVDGGTQLHGEREDGLQFDFAAMTYPDGSVRASMAVGRDRTR